MQWQLFHLTAMGGAHRQRQLPCQDRALSAQGHGARIVMVADGHGSRRHFRSERGAAFACETAMAELQQLLDALPEGGMPSEEDFTALKERILAAWQARVLRDAAEEPWSDAELAEAASLMSAEDFSRLIHGEQTLLPYGSTLVAAFATDAFWAGIQIGDGMLVTVDAQGQYLWPMPESRVNEGNRTASLCMRSPMPEFRHCMGTEPLTGLIVCTDGVEKAFPPMGEKVVSFLHWLWQAARETPETAGQLLAAAAERTAQCSVVRDDVGIALMADADAPDVSPCLTGQQQALARQQGDAQLQAQQDMIQYTAAQLADAASPEEAEELRQVLARQMSGLAALQATRPEASDPPAEKKPGPLARIRARLIPEGRGRP
ncbi:MAG: PP2C family serine/threonine-protein phosphatase [Aristaeellaceae bacterium]